MTRQGGHGRRAVELAGLARWFMTGRGDGHRDSEVSQEATGSRDTYQSGRDQHVHHHYAQPPERGGVAGSGEVVSLPATPFLVSRQAETDRLLEVLAPGSADAAATAAVSGAGVPAGGVVVVSAVQGLGDRQDRAGSARRAPGGGARLVHR
ncbi:hypothetical protein ACFOY4_04890 [Actinomadura syzygii]|uniref:Uncharacterized protein n=2 Tax=Actinomadura syzygii TaxID=1427538 RepID=A0A5D0TXF5_9ACTN|nr:hypothetical protein [Actinomadura syzygii]TYC10025.1 hypothetical protein FXF65_33560 [Actinomadura syzygii]